MSDPIKFNPSGQAIKLQRDKNALVNEKQQEVAQTFEKIFAKHLVTELTKGSFNGDDNAGGSFAIYRDQITDTLASELASQRKLGMADMLSRHWKLNENS